MKNPKPLIILTVMAIAITALAQGDTTATPATAPTQWLLASIPVIVPLLIALGKTVAPKVPTWLLPIMAPALGILIDYLNSLATGVHDSPITAAVAGAAGVGVRELIDQAKTRLLDGPKPTTP